MKIKLFLSLALVCFSVASVYADTRIDCDRAITQHFRAVDSRIEIDGVVQLSEKYNLIDMYEVRTRKAEHDGSLYWLILTTPDWLNKHNDCKVKAAEGSQIYSES